jgi:hypothetical protein
MDLIQLSEGVFNGRDNTRIVPLDHDEPMRAEQFAH